MMRAAAILRVTTLILFLASLHHHPCYGLTQLMPINPIPSSTSKTCVILYHKPADTITSHTNQAHDARPTVYDSIGLTNTNSKTTTNWHSIGRLDADTTGALLLTNDALLVHAATNPSSKVTLTNCTNTASTTYTFSKVSKRYEALVMGHITEDNNDMLRRLREGVYLGEKLGVTQPAIVNVMETKKTTTLVSIEISEGKNRQIRRMFHAVGSGVIKLHRAQFGGISLGDLKEGEWRVLSAEEIWNGLGGWPIRELEKKNNVEENGGSDHLRHRNNNSNARSSSRKRDGVYGRSSSVKAGGAKKGKIRRSRNKKKKILQSSTMNQPTRQ
mmetsp:Transcript_27102/g.42100  ORF Transcript_27102/g.42100 Transcript_27102/m.42100 type:complete len:329 (-) Transcript_27102:971-1957(-)